MLNTWYSLAYKEWHEHKWKLVAMLATLLGVTSLVILLERGRDRLGLAVGMLFLCSIPMAVFVGLGAAANERSRGTLPFLQSLPVPMWRVAVLKLLFGFITIFVAVAVTVASFSLWMWIFDRLGIQYGAALRVAEDGPRLNTGYWQIDVALYCVPVVASLFLWAAATGVNRRDEVSAGVVALAAMVGAWALLIFVIYGVKSDDTPSDLLQVVALSLAPGSFAIVADSPQLARFLSIGAIVAVVVHAALAARYIRRFGRVTDIGRRSPQVAPIHANDWLGPPRESVMNAIAWKQFRESGLIALAGLLGIVGICAFMFAIERGNAEFAQIYSSVAISLGFGIALVAGIGVALHDSEPRLNAFWRTRPINPDLWFGVKFLTGLVIVVLAIYVPLLLVGGWALASEHDPNRPLLLVLLPASHIALYAAAVATTCLVRHAIYAAILSIGSLVACLGAAWLAWDAAARLGWAESTKDAEPIVSNPTIVLAGAIMCFLLSTLIAWLSMRNDWGLKSRY